jgi:hypothetical protein
MNKNSFKKKLHNARRVDCGIFEQQEFEDVCPSSFDAASAAENRKRRGGKKTTKEKVVEELDLVSRISRLADAAELLVRLKTEEQKEAMKYALLEMERQNERKEADHQVYLKHKKLEELRAQEEILELTKKLKG